MAVPDFEDDEQPPQHPQHVQHPHPVAAEDHPAPAVCEIDVTSVSSALDDNDIDDVS